MTIYLRNQSNNTVVDIEIWKKRELLSPTKSIEYVELRSSVNMETYSRLLLNHPEKNKAIEAFGELAELRGWFWERYKAVENKNPEVHEVISAVKDILAPIAKEFNLHIVVD